MATVLLLHPGELMPGIALPDSAGNIVQLKAFKQRRPLLVALLHSAACSDCHRWLSTLAIAHDDLAYFGVQPLLIFPDDPASLRALKAELDLPDLPGLLLSDPQHETLSRYLRAKENASHLPVLLVAVNRYSVCLDAWLADEPSLWPTLAEPLATFALADQDDCACGLPIWPDV